MNLDNSISFIENQIENPSVGLPEEVFLFASRITPMVNVDLLIKDEFGRILLSWRDDEFCGKGWHIPGGIIRYKESFEDRIKKTALKEIGALVEYNPSPLEIANFIHPQLSTRGHFISFLYECKLSSEYILPNKNLCETDVGYLKWYKKCPDNFLKVQNVYNKYFSEME